MFKTRSNHFPNIIKRKRRTEENDIKQIYQSKKIRRRRRRRTMSHGAMTRNEMHRRDLENAILKRFGIGKDVRTLNISRYELRQLWNVSEDDMKFEEVTKMFCLAKCDDDDDNNNNNDGNSTGNNSRKVNVKKMLDLIESYDFSTKNENELTNDRGLLGSSRMKEVLEAKMNADEAIKRANNHEKQKRESEKKSELLVRLKIATRNEAKALEEISNAKVASKLLVMNTYDSLDEARTRANKAEEERDELKEKLKQMFEEIRKLRNGEHFEALRERLIAREQKMKEKMNKMSDEIESLRFELVERDAEIIRYCSKYCKSDKNST